MHCASARQQIPLQNQVIAASTPTLYALQWNGNLSFEEERSSQQMTKRGEMLSEGPRKISLASGGQNQRDGTGNAGKVKTDGAFSIRQTELEFLKASSH